MHTSPTSPPIVGLLPIQPGAVASASVSTLGAKSAPLPIMDTVDIVDCTNQGGDSPQRPVRSKNAAPGQSQKASTELAPDDARNTADGSDLDIIV